MESALGMVCMCVCYIVMCSDWWTWGGLSIGNLEVEGVTTTTTLCVFF